VGLRLRGHGASSGAVSGETRPLRMSLHSQTRRRALDPTQVIPGCTILGPRAVLKTGVATACPTAPFSLLSADPVTVRQV